MDKVKIFWIKLVEVILLFLGNLAEEAESIQSSPVNSRLLQMEKSKYFSVAAAGFRIWGPRNLFHKWDKAGYIRLGYTYVDNQDNFRLDPKP